jgi:hypothetical protein
MLRTFTALALLLAARTTVGAAPEVKVSTLDGRTLEGEAQSITGETILLRTASGEITVKSDELGALIPKDPPQSRGDKPAAWVELVDGTRLPATSYLSKDGKVTITLSDETELSLLTKQVRSVRYHKLDEPDAELATTEAVGDVLGVRKGDSVDFLDGVIGDVTKEAVHFRFQGQSIPVNPARVDSLAYARRANDDDGPAPACIVEESSGASLRAKSVELKDGKLRLGLMVGGSIERPFDGVRRLDFSAGKLTYLSDLKPESVQWTPFFDLGRQSPALARYLGPRFDRGREDEVMRLDGKTYKKGVSLTSRTELVYKLPARAKRFQAIAGIDDGVGGLGSVQLEIKGDGRQLYSGELTGKDPPAELDLELAGVRRLVILVDFGDDLDVADHLNLCEARIVK